MKRIWINRAFLFVIISTWLKEVARNNWIRAIIRVVSGIIAAFLAFLFIGFLWYVNPWALPAALGVVLIIGIIAFVKSELDTEDYYEQRRKEYEKAAKITAAIAEARKKTQ